MREQKEYAEKQLELKEKEITKIKSKMEHCTINFLYRKFIFRYFFRMNQIKNNRDLRGIEFLIELIVS